MSHTPDRMKQNDLSRNRAEHHREPWSAEELQILEAFFDPDDIDGSLAEISETLGRTVEACRQRHYYPGGQHAMEAERRQPRHSDGWLMDFCEDCGRFEDVWCSGLSKKCIDCKAKA